MFGDGDRPIVYRLSCNGYETNITHCSKYTYLTFTCSREPIAGVRCNHGLNSVANLHVHAGINGVLQAVLMVTYVSLEVVVRLREQWRYVMTKHGGWCLD